MESKGIKVNPERQRQRFSAEFKREAVRLLEMVQKPATQLALELGVAGLVHLDYMVFNVACRRIDHSNLRGKGLSLPPSCANISEVAFNF